MSRKFVLPVVAAFCLLAPVASLTAQDTTAPVTKTAKVKKVKTVKFTIANQGTTSLDLKSGDTPVTIAPGQSQSLTAVAGTKIVTASDSSRGTAGTVVAQVTDDMNGSTVSLH